MISSPMHIAFCVNDHYAEYILVSIKGLLENNSDPLVIHILSDYISDKNTNRLKKLVGLYPNAILDIVIVDDLIATGGTTEAIIKLIEQLGGEVVKIIFLIELEGLKGREKLSGYDVDAVIKYAGK